MTQRNWFIFNGDHHTGPFTQEEITSKILLSELTKNNLIWKEGEKDWMPVHDYSEFLHLFSKSLELPIESRSDFNFKGPEDLMGLDEVGPSERKSSLDKRISAINLSEVSAKRSNGHAVVKQEGEFGTEVELDFSDDPPEVPVLPYDLPALPTEPKKEIEEANRASEVFDEYDYGENLDIDLSFEKEMISKKNKLDSSKQVDDFNGFSKNNNREDEIDSTTKIDEKDEDNKSSEENKKLELACETEEKELLHSESHFELSHLKFYASAVLGIIGIAFFASYLWNIFNPRTIAYGLSKRDRESILHVTQQAYEDKLVYKIRPTRDLSSLWLGANYPGEGWSVLRLKSIRGRYMGESPVELLSQATYENGLSYFDAVEIVKGEGIISGEYEYTLEFTPGRRSISWSRVWEDIPYIWDSLKSDEDIKREVLKGTILLSKLPQKSFESKLKEYLVSLDLRLIQPLKERKQRYETLLSLLDQMKEIYSRTLNRISKGSTIYLFENEYNKQIGPILRDLIIDSHKRHLSYLNLRPKLSKNYQDLSEYGKEIGELASYMVTETKKYKRLNKKISQKLSQNIGDRAIIIFNKGIFKVKELTQKLEQFK